MFSSPCSLGCGWTPSVATGLRPVGLWVPVGVTGVVRNAERNSDIIAEVPLELLVIPAAVFLRDWFHPYAAPPTCPNSAPVSPSRGAVMNPPLCRAHDAVSRRVKADRSV